MPAVQYMFSIFTGNRSVITIHPYLTLGPLSEMLHSIGFDYYGELDESLRKKRMNMAKVCEMMQWCCKNLGLLNQEGFTTDVHPDNTMSSTFSE